MRGPGTAGQAPARRTNLDDNVKKKKKSPDNYFMGLEIGCTEFRSIVSLVFIKHEGSCIGNQSGLFGENRSFKFVDIWSIKRQRDRTFVNSIAPCDFQCVRRIHFYANGRGQRERLHIGRVFFFSTKLIVSDKRNNTR